VTAEIERRSLVGKLEIRAGEENPNGGFSGYANLSEVRDEYGCIIKRGAYQDLDKLVRDGFVAEGHDWGEMGCAYITLAEERELGLYIEATFHSDDESQAIRKKVQERQAAGKSVALSIGFYSTEWNMAEVDGEETRMITGLVVKEVSLVTVPGTPGSQVTDVRGGKTYAQEFDAVRDAVAGLVRRTGEIAQLRDSLSAEKKAQIVTLADDFAGAEASLRALVAAEITPDPDFLAELESTYRSLGS